MARDIGIGLLGCGMMGKYICPINEQRGSRLQVRALCDASEDTLRDISARYGIPETTTSYDALLGRSDIDVVAIFTPDHLHLEHILQAIDAGKHVICTKPMVSSLAEAARVVKAAESSGLVLFVGQTMRFNLRMMTARRLFEDGDLGELSFAESYYTHDYRPFLKPDAPWRREPPIDLLVGGGCHPIDLVTWFMGEAVEVHALACSGGLSPGYSLPDNFLINIRFAYGKIGRVMAAYGIVEPGSGHISLALYGSRGTFNDDRYAVDRLPGLPWVKPEYPPREQGHHMEVIRYLQHFERCLCEGEKPLIGPREAAHVLAITDAVWESVRSGEPARVRTLAEASA